MDAELRLQKASRHEAIREAAATGDSDVQHFYCGRVVFLTGGSGFLGKQLVEKLLRSCKISKIYMLLRAKKSKGIEQRLDDILKDPISDKQTLARAWNVQRHLATGKTTFAGSASYLYKEVFSILREQEPDFASKIKAVAGDVSEINLGLHESDWKMLTEEVNVIFHVAATTKFDEALRLATMINLRGTRECLKLGKSCKKLCSYVHVSTAYTHAQSKMVGGKVEEKFYPMPVRPDTMISMAEDMDNERLKCITAGLIKDWPNTYCFTKALAEEMIREMSTDLPICIVRPGIVITTYREPTSGWIDQNALFSASGVVAGTFLGLLHTIRVNRDIKLCLVPCDYVNNTIIAAGREVALKQARGGDDTPIYFATSTSSNPIIWRKMSEILNGEGEKYTTPKEMYYGFLVETKCKFYFMALTLFMHMIPAYIADFICLILGKERKFAKVAKKIYSMCVAFLYFSINDWIFTDNNARSLYDGLSKQDQVIFNFDMSDINWNEMILHWVLGIRKYILKDGLKSAKHPVNRHKVLRFIHYGVMIIYVYVLWKTVSLIFAFGMSLFSSVCN